MRLRTLSSPEGSHSAGLVIISSKSVSRPFDYCNVRKVDPQTR